MIKVTKGKYKNKKIITTNFKNTRPTMAVVKESIFNIVDPLDKSVLDLFSGTGQLALEALSLGANLVVCVDNDKEVIDYLWKNKKNLNIKEEMQIFKQDYLHYISSANSEFDLIFVNPPYKNVDFYKNAFDEIYKNNLLSKNGMIISEINFKNMPVEFYEKHFFLLKERKYGKTTITYLTLR